MNPPTTVSAQTDRFVHDRLPPPKTLPELLFDARARVEIERAAVLPN